MKNFKLFITASNGERIFATKTFKTIPQFSKWFANNIDMFNTSINFVLGLTPVEIHYNYAKKNVLIKNKETQEWIYKGE
nr:MAG TPA: hypothetical protein [Caudoviricetes sp.]